MKIKQLLGMMALDANANEVGKIDDAEKKLRKKLKKKK